MNGWQKTSTFAFSKQLMPDNKRKLLLVLKCHWAEELPWENTWLFSVRLLPEHLSDELSAFVGLGVRSLDTKVASGLWTITIC